MDGYVLCSRMQIEVRYKLQQDSMLSKITNHSYALLHQNADYNRLPVVVTISHSMIPVVVWHKPLQI